MSDPVERVIDALTARGCDPKRAGDRWAARCPAHEDHDPSLTVSEGDDGRALLHCHAGCEQRSVVDALGFSWPNLFTENGRGTDFNIASTYDYTDESGTLLYQVVRLDPMPGEPKPFRQRRPDGLGGWTWKLGDVRRVLYRLPEVIPTAKAGEMVFVVEGEKDADRLASLGLTATTSPGGAAQQGHRPKWRDEYSESLRGAHVFLIPDNDDAGRAHMQAAARSLHGIAASIKVIELPKLPAKGDVNDWLDAGHTPMDLLTLAKDAAEVGSQVEPDAEPTSDGQDGDGDPAISLNDFYAYMPQHNYIYRPTREHWPSASVNALVPSVKIGKKTISSTTWLDSHRYVEQMTWAPGESELLEGRLFDSAGGGWVVKEGARLYNLYRPPTIKPANAEQAQPWVDHVRKVYPLEADHIIRWLAHRVQKPQEKVNHALVLGGAQGIGKDAIIYPVRRAVGEWNAPEIRPADLLARFNPWVQAVILIISEARDLGGDAENPKGRDRYAFYEHLKVYAAAPPNTLQCERKHITAYAVPNICGLIITTNHPDGIYIPSDDRRLYVAWNGSFSQDSFDDAYWTELYGWYEHGGNEHAMTYLAAVDLGEFNAAAPPKKTEGWHRFVDAGRSPETAMLSDALDALGDPDAVTLSDVVQKAHREVSAMLTERGGRRRVPHLMAEAGYEPLRNPWANDGLWKVAGRRQVVYVRKGVSELRRQAAAKTRVDRGA